MLEPSAPGELLLTAIVGLQDAVKRGQQAMMAAAKARREAAAAAAAALAEGGDAPAPPVPPPATNLVVDALRAAGGLEKLEALYGHPDENVTAKANAFIMMLQFM